MSIMKLTFFIMLVCTSFILYSNNNDTVFWNNNSFISLEDFKAIPPVNSEVSAISNLQFQIYLAGENLICINSYFLKSCSWIKSRDSILLKHEQGHFDILEIICRRLRKAIQEQNFTYDNISVKIDSLNSHYNVEYRLLQDKYDASTDFSRNKKSQEEWTLFINQSLKELEAYATTFVKIHINP